MKINIKEPTIKISTDTQEVNKSTNNYEELYNQPLINNVTLIGDKTSEDLGLQPAGDYALESEIPTKTSDLTNDSGFITGYTETDPTVPSYVKNITQANITSWNNKSDFSGNYKDLNNKPTNLSDFTNDVGYTTNTGTITEIIMNGSSLGTSGSINLGTVITSHQDISGKLDANKVKNTYSTTSGDVYDVTYINSTIGDIESLLAEV